MQTFIQASAATFIEHITTNAKEPLPKPVVAALAAMTPAELKAVSEAIVDQAKSDPSVVPQIQAQLSKLQLSARGRSRRSVRGSAVRIV